MYVHLCVRTCGVVVAVTVAGAAVLLALFLRSLLQERLKTNTCEETLCCGFIHFGVWVFKCAYYSISITALLILFCTFLH